MKVVIVGAGIVGLSCAAYLLRDGHSVTVLERDGPGEGTSKGNAGALSPGSCVPLAMPGVFRKIPGWLANPDGPLTIRPAYLARAFPWLVRFSLSARPARVVQIADALRALHRHVFECYEPLLKNAHCEDLIKRTGTLVVYRSEAAFRASEREWRLREERGAAVQRMNAGELREMEPALATAFSHGALLPDHGYVANPYRLVKALAERFVADGGVIERALVRGLRSEAAGARVLKEGGEVPADRVILAAGAWSGSLARSLGCSLPLESQRGYHVTLPDAGVKPRLPVTSSEDKYYATPMEAGLRVAGTVEFAGLEAPPDYRRARRLLAQVREMYPGARTDEFTEWMGHRPCLPDSLPAIGPAPGHPNVLFAFGHGHNGMTSGPVTGRLVADLLAGRTPFIDPTPYSAARFE